jgi:drug/metabolite transporter (DMT)-like permease
MSKASAWLNGFIGILIFSGSLPATRVAVLGLDPMFVTVARASIAGVLAVAILMLRSAGLPSRRDLMSLCVVALGVVLGFPLLTALALRHITSAQSMVFVGMLPLATSLFGVIRGGERPGRGFWLFAVLGAAAVVGFAFSHRAPSSVAGAWLMLGAILACGLGYAEGAVLSRRLGGLAVICWALVVALPVMLAALWLAWPAAPGDVPARAWVGLAYVSLFSMLIGFVFWYRGLAGGGIATVGQLQLLQPFFGLLLAATLLGEPFTWPMVLVMVIAALCVAGARRMA